MPQYANKDDRLLDRTIDRWKQNARYEVDDIGGWRDAAEQRPSSGDPSRQWGNLSSRFYGDTAFICGAITSRYAKLDPTPLMDIYEAVAAWYSDHNAKRIASQSVLWSTLERATLTLQAIEADIGSRMVDSPPARTPQNAAPEHAKPSADDAADARGRPVMADSDQNAPMWNVGHDDEQRTPYWIVEPAADNFTRLCRALDGILGHLGFMVSSRKSGTHLDDADTIMWLWDVWQDIRTAQQMVDAIPAEALQDLSTLAGKPWDLAARRTLDAIHKVMWWSCVWFNERTSAPTVGEKEGRWTLDGLQRCDPSKLRAALDDLKPLYHDLKALRGRQYPTRQPQNATPRIQPGDIVIKGGDGGPASPGRNVFIIGGDAGPDAAGGAVVIQAGSGRPKENPTPASVSGVCLNEAVEPTANAKTDGGDATRHEAAGGGDSKPQEQTRPVCQSKLVKLFGRGEQPEVNGKRKPTLTTARYDAVKALIATGENGLTKDELDRESKHGDARKALKRLADKDCDWKRVISFAGTTGKRYRIL